MASQEKSQALALLVREIPKLAAAARQLDNAVLLMLLERAEEELRSAAGANREAEICSEPGCSLEQRE